MGTTTNYGWEYPDVGGDASTWGTIANALYVAVDAQVKAIQDAATAGAVPTGALAHCLFAFAPTGWVTLDGGTIGNASSNGTLRANADTSDLFVNIWNQYDNTACPIRTSAGALTSRGANAAADYAANKALGTPDLRGYVLRAWDDGRGIDSGRGFGTFQADALLGHTHTFAFTLGADAAGSVPADGSGSTNSFSSTTGSVGGAENLVKNFAGYIICKL